MGVPRTARWPDLALDVAALRAAGHRPAPFQDVVLKVHQRCNLACDYCYVYTMADRSWRDRPPVMERATWLKAADRMAEHAAAHGSSTIRLVLHGGEPLLAGLDRLTALVGDFRARFTGDCRLDIQVQTNAVLLDTALLDLFRRQGVRVGVSLDGTAGDNDRRRRHADGRGSHAAVDRALRLLGSPAYREVFAGLLCTVDPSTDPLATYGALLAYGPPQVDLLIPHANWSTPPERDPAGSGTPHADWLIAVFDRWYDAPRQETGIRLFEDVIALVLGGSSRSEQVGLSPVAAVVVESDGSIELVDSLKSSYPGACFTGLTVFDDPFDAALDHPGVVARQIGVEALSPACRACPMHTVCGGGHYAHRYRAGAGYLNPSVYCADLGRLIRHVSSRVATDLRRLQA
ncbi:FxsB family cyclophane-forming radical SAM/SPASM peptide maturase [Actinoplanes sp. NPDC049548]|uniref:FxsB family cyclophane-forming radical SAM/SPASM peptide maturase n=1 Tax=Actinoplanes sp. NPDC049548 TaxID=3155152 RepID=UPI0034377101